MLHAKYNGYDVHLIEDVSEFEVIKKLCSKKVDAGVDTETSGLNITDTIAGVCLSCGNGYQPGQYHGFYLPIRHVGYKKNLPITAVMELTMWIIDNFKTVWWNRDYDFNMLERDGCELPNCGSTHDAQCMAHLVKGDPFPALKDFAHDYCKLEVIHFSDNNAENNNFQLTDPTVTFKYAAQDPIITVLVARKIWAEYPHIRKVYPIDNRFAECMRRVMNNTDLYLDLNIVNQQLNKVTSELAVIKQQIFSFTGYQFRLTSNKDIADALSRYVTLTAKTKKGAWDVSKDVLQELDTPLASMILKFKHLEKFRSTYLEKMVKFPQPFHINYQHANVATGRLSSGSSKGNDFFAPFNIQNVPKVEIFRYLHYAPVSSPIKWVLDDSPYCSLADGMMVTMADGSTKPLRDVKVGEKVMTNKGAKDVLDCGELKTVLKPYEGTRMNKSGEWVFVTFYPEDSKTWFIDLGDDVYSIKSSNYDVQIRTLQKMKCKGGMRDCFVCPEGYVWLSADYSSQEMVLMANFSNEPNLINPLLQGEDIHKYVGTKMFGHYDKSHRTIAKTINFASNYGASGYSIGKKLGKSSEEGQALLDKYNATMSKLYTWKQEMIKEGRRKGIVYTYFGRPRAVWMYYQSSDRSKHSFADRTCMNSPVQGTGGDIIRLDYIKYQSSIDPKSKTYDKGFAENTLHALTVHDEINLFVKPEYVPQAFNKLRSIMELSFPNWKVPLKVSPSVGMDWGHQIECLGFTEDGTMIPDCEEDISLL